MQSTVENITVAQTSADRIYIQLLAVNRKIMLKTEQIWNGGSQDSHTSFTCEPKPESEFETVRIYYATSPDIPVNSYTLYSGQPLTISGNTTVLTYGALGMKLSDIGKYSFIINDEYTPVWDGELPPLPPEAQNLTSVIWIYHSGGLLSPGTICLATAQNASTIIHISAASQGMLVNSSGNSVSIYYWELLFYGNGFPYWGRRMSNNNNTVGLFPFGTVAKIEWSASDIMTYGSGSAQYPHGTVICYGSQPPKL
jgi:hypothetical protein